MRLALILAIFVFIITVLVRLPARVLQRLLPADVTCAGPTGTLWSGSCGELRAGGFAVSGLGWTLHPAALLRLHVAADLASQDPRAQGHARIDLAPNGDLAISALAASLAIPNGLGLFPAGSSGSVQLAVDSARVENGHLVALQGKADLLQFHIANPPADLGSFELLFAPPVQADPMVGQLRDLNGPLSVIGVLQLSRAGSYDLEGSIAPRAGASDDMTQLLQLLGPPDAQNRRAFSLAGSL